jgi:hypothetical protein
MASHAMTGLVIFTHRRADLVSFYSALTQWPTISVDDGSTTLSDGAFDIVVHEAHGDESEYSLRTEAAVKPVFSVTTESKERALQSGGQLLDFGQFRAGDTEYCAVSDPDGNVVTLTVKVSP